MPPAGRGRPSPGPHHGPRPGGARGNPSQRVGMTTQPGGRLNLMIMRNRCTSASILNYRHAQWKGGIDLGSRLPRGFCIPGNGVPPAITTHCPLPPRPRQGAGGRMGALRGGETGRRPPIESVNLASMHERSGSFSGLSSGDSNGYLLFIVSFSSSSSSSPLSGVLVERTVHHPFVHR
jgi:hypothetical protein